jgi:RNA polymerase sigma-70 factor (ECF subfamily)
MSTHGSDALARSTADAVAHRSYGKLVAFLAARTRDVAAAEDALSDAFAAALADWPVRGCPANPEAWLLTAARRRIIDAGRRRRHGEVAAAELELLAESLDAAGANEEIPDHRLALMFACAHPAIEAAVRAPLMLQTVLGLDARRIASAFLTSPATMGKRLVRAKTKIREAGIPLRIPEREELAGRLDAVLAAIYAAFAEGWSDPGGTDVARRDLTAEAMFLARLVAGLLPQEAEALLARASTLGAIGRFQIEGALQSAHVHRRRSGEANWASIVQLYDALYAITASPVVAINRALAIAEVDGAQVALEAMPHVADDARLTEYQPYWAARAELQAKAGLADEARHAYEVAIGLERDPAVRHFLQQRQSRVR